MTPSPSTACYWHNRGDVIKVTRLPGFCENGKDDCVVVQDELGAMFDACVDDLFEREMQALGRARQYCWKRIKEINNRCASIL